ncbi:MAG: OmpA family protein [Candidatus Sumerlaeia bacterium]|nr:OmpA family protein [Candidatus Sumerlaeia bacterium]
MRHTRLSMIAGAVALAALVSGCSSTQKGAAAGGALGGIAGGVVGHNVSAVTMGQGIVMGAGGGVAVGGLTGDAYDQITEKDEQRELENLRAQLAEREAQLAALAGNTASEEELALVTGERDRIAGELAAIQGERDGLLAKVSDLERGMANTARANADLQAANNRVNDLNGRLEAANRQLEDALRARSEAEAARGLIEGERDRLKNELDLRNRDLEAARNRANLLQASLDTKGQEFERLRGDLAKLNVQLEETTRGLTLTIAEELLFSAGKATLSTGGDTLIARVSTIIQQQFPGREIMVEGHTDNQPIKRSGWKSNWELGSARALAIVHDMVNKQGFDPAKISATTYGEFRPVTENSTADGRKLNRRAVIVILPEKMPVEVKQLADSKQ